MKHLRTLLAALLLAAGSVRAEKPAAPDQFVAGGPEAGVNITSLGNNYGDPEFRDEPLGRLFTALKERGIKRISLRVTWSTMERQEGSLNPAILAAMKRIYGKAHSYGFKAMLDFHTLFLKDSYACPEWVPQHEQDDGSPGFHSIAMIARSKAVRERYLAYVAGVVTEMKDCEAIDVVSVMNEPCSTEWKNPSLMAADMDQIKSVIEKAACIVREKLPGRRVAVRFMGEINPWSQNPAHRLDTRRMLNALDIIGQNVYLDPDNDNATIPRKLSHGTRPSLSWDIVIGASEQCRKAGKAFWITEFGAPWQGELCGIKDGSLELQKQYFAGYCRRFWGEAIRPETVLAWVIQPNSQSKAAGQLYDGAARTFHPAFDIYSQYSLKAVTTKQSERQQP
jgi:hypothetical protein